jgi:glycerol kinase
VVLALDCGTHAIRLFAFDLVTGESTLCGEQDIPLSFPHPGWVEVDPEMLAASAVRLIRAAVHWADEFGKDIVALGVTNMRETAFAWHRETGRPLHAGVMWMSQQSLPVVERWREAGLDALIRERTGLGNDTFFFGSKVAWLLDEVTEVRAAAECGALAVGTVDTWLIHRLTAGAVHRTDVSNASRTQVLDLQTAAWDVRLCDSLGIPIGCLPDVTPSMADYGVTDARVCGRAIPITGVVADQQASLLGHGCEQPGTAKATFGTSGVVSLNTGAEIVLRPGMVTSIGWSDGQGPLVYETEGSAFHSGYTLTWLSERNGIELGPEFRLDRCPLPAEDRVYVLPSFTALGAPRWPSRRGAVITGLAMDTTTRDMMRAGVEAMAFQAYDMFEAIGDSADVAEVNVDGGGARSDYLCHLLADLLGRDVVRPTNRELTSAGAAKAALRGVGEKADVFFGQDRGRAERFHPEQGDPYARTGYQHWVQLVDEILH